MHVVRHPSTARVRLARLDPPTPVLEYAEQHGLAEVISGGFFAKPEDVPLGELVTPEGNGYLPFRAPYDRVRGALRIGPDRPEIGARHKLTPGGELLQAGPLLVAGGRRVVADTDPEGFAATQDEFDQDLTSERLPRMAVALTAGGEWLAVAVDGRAPDEAGLFLGELADVLIGLGAHDALNLDGGSSSALVAGGELRNTPRDDEGNVLDAAGPTTSAIVFG